MVVAATFHTYPNVGEGFIQEPSLTDLRAVRDDPDLAHLEYEGEYVISYELLYLIRRTGRFEVVGPTAAMLQLNEDRKSP
jgi:hypothetical protein